MNDDSPPRSLPDGLIAALTYRLSERFSLAKSVRAHHGRDESHFPEALPDAVAWPHNSEEVVELVKLCRIHHVPIIPFGAGSSLEGHVLAIHGGISVDFSQMNQILEIHPEDMDAKVQPGVTRKQLNAALNGTGLFFPVDPGADASLGGMAATRASGTNAVRYGTMRENVLALEVVTADGRIMRTGSRARKSSAGYDLTHCMVGSEGTLGLITELTLKLHPLPEAVSAAVCVFPDVQPAVQAVMQTIQMGIPIARIEFLDALTVQAINRYSKTTLREAPMLFFEFHGTPASVAEQSESVQAIAHEYGGQEFEWATHPEERSRLWQARHDTYFACINLRPGCRGITTDVCVPISRLAECMEGVRLDIQASGLIAPIVGHVGDGNFHTLILVDPDDRAEIARAEALNRKIVSRALSMDGTCTGEHGIGYGKRDFLRLEHGDTAIEMMRSLKRAFDPDNLLNPGKVV